MQSSHSAQLFPILQLAVHDSIMSLQTLSLLVHMLLLLLLLSLQGANGYSNTNNSTSNNSVFVDHPTLRSGLSSTALTGTNSSSSTPLFPETPCPTDVDEQLLHKVSCCAGTLQ
jgi:hypothetical protein